MPKKCPCNHCSGHIEFDCERAGQVVACPHCGLDTKLYIPQVPLPGPTTGTIPPVLNALPQGAKGETKRVTPIKIGVVILSLAIVVMLVFATFSRNERLVTIFHQAAGSGGWSKTNVIQQGDIQIKVEDWSELADVYVESPGDPGGFATYNHFFTLRVVVSNLSKTKKVDFTTWRGEPSSFARDYAILSDNNGNIYKRINFGSKPIRENPFRNVENETVIYPQESATDLLVFELLVKDVKWLHLELPGRNYGGHGMLRFEIPVDGTSWRDSRNL